MIEYVLDQVCAGKVMGEPSFSLFKHRGLYCLIIRGFGMTLNGYVAVGKDHPLYGKQGRDTVYSPTADSTSFNGNWISLLVADVTLADAGFYPLDLIIEVHHGLTWASGHAPGIYHKELGDLWWFGFDTGHAWDTKPLEMSFDGFTPSFGASTYKDWNFVHKEVIKLADQLRAFQPKPLIDVEPFQIRLQMALAKIEISIMIKCDKYLTS